MARSESIFCWPLRRVGLRFFEERFVLCVVVEDFAAGFWIVSELCAATAGIAAHDRINAMIAPARALRISVGCVIGSS